MEHSNRLTSTSILIMTMPFSPFSVGAETTSHHEARMNSEQFKIEIAASQQRATLELEQSTQALKQQMESYIRSETIWLERYQVRQIEMSKDIKELLRREGL